MKKKFFDIIIDRMKKEKDIYFISIGLGWPRTDEMVQFKDRFIQTEAAEQTALDIACTIALSGKKPFCYSITPFLLWRGAETIRSFIDHENIPVRLVGAGRDEDYSQHDGFTHDAKDDKQLMKIFKNIKCYWPVDDNDLEANVDTMIQLNTPSYLNIKR